LRNKKYRQWKLIIMMGAFALLASVSIIFASEKWEHVFLISCTSVFILVDILLFPLYFTVQSDSIIVMQGVFSRNRAYESSFKKRVFIFEEIEDITVEGKMLVWIKLKDGNSITFSIQGCFRKNEIIGLIYEARAQIKGYEQQYI